MRVPRSTQEAPGGRHLASREIEAPLHRAGGHPARSAPRRHPDSRPGRWPRPSVKQKENGARKMGNKKHGSPGFFLQRSKSFARLPEIIGHYQSNYCRIGRKWVYVKIGGPTKWAICRLLTFNTIPQKVPTKEYIPESHLMVRKKPPCWLKSCSILIGLSTYNMQLQSPSRRMPMP